MMSVVNKPFMQSVTMLNVYLLCHKYARYAECHYAERLNADCRK
jgi:hypothetical protein